MSTLDAAAQLKNQAQQLQQELVGDIRIGVHTDFEFMRIGELHRSLQTHHPQGQPHFMQSMTAQILPDVRRGVLDGGFFFGPVMLPIWRSSWRRCRCVSSDRTPGRIASPRPRLSSSRRCPGSIPGFLSLLSADANRCWTTWRASPAGGLLRQ